MNRSIYFSDELEKSIKDQSEKLGVSFSKFVTMSLMDKKTRLISDGVTFHPDSERGQLDRIEKKLDRIIMGPNSKSYPHMFGKSQDEKPSERSDFSDEDLEAANERLKKKRTEIPGAAKTAAEMKTALDNFSPYSKELQLGKKGKGFKKK